MKGNKFVFNKKTDDIDGILETIKENSLDNRFSIVNENIDINDCGVSGVVLGDVSVEWVYDGNIGVTIHLGDLLRLSNIPSILKSED